MGARSLFGTVGNLGNKTRVLYVEQDVIAKCWLKKLISQMAAPLYTAFLSALPG